MQKKQPNDHQFEENACNSQEGDIANMIFSRQQAKLCDTVYFLKLTLGALLLNV